ncbi:porin family protein [Xenorhabdus koppenhoeferi]|uniref:Tetratricopeptide repeat-containing protein n=1 Tax=Xenorhabdus koppenhoeferi TaxID=351659 RepID=A0A1I7JYN7_9GAMM|nr:porin family protein [Xenorhabdus koppenhoeferi]SFU90257.1 Tetratricopeptide repeat-containing protein [Xenorhabdus koppenhoeferi]
MSDNRTTPILSAALMTLCLSLPAYTDEDTSRKIWQEAQHNQQENETNLITPEPIFVEYNSSFIVLNGQTFQVENNINDIGQALYLAINHRQWPDVRRFLAAYQKLPEHDIMLVNFALGGLARLEGDLDLAAYHYQQILNQQPDFSRIKLELARIYFEDHKNREAKQLFSGLSEAQQLPEVVLKNINSYLEAIDLRNGWRGSFSAGYAYNDNVNMSPDQGPVCQKFLGDKCEIERRIPKAIKAWGMSYDATLSRRYQLAGHHGIFGRGLIYGENYRDYHDGDENTFLLVGGYNFKNRNHDFSFGPLFEYKQRTDDTNYRATGAKTEWRWAFTAQTALNVELEHKQLRHQQQRYHRKDSELSSTYLTLSHAINKDFVLFGGGDWVYRNNDKHPLDRYQQLGIRAGIAGQLYPGINGSLFATLKERRFGAYSPILETRRQDTEQIYTAVIKVPAAEILGMIPSLTFRHRHNHSNVNWLYSYNKNEVLLRLEKYF